MGIKENFQQAVRELTGGGKAETGKNDRSVSGMKNAVAADDTSEFPSLSEIDKKAEERRAEYDRAQEGFPDDYNTLINRGRREEVQSDDISFGGRKAGTDDYTVYGADTGDNDGRASGEGASSGSYDDYSRDDDTDTGMPSVTQDNEYYEGPGASRQPVQDQASDMMMPVDESVSTTSKGFWPGAVQRKPSQQKPPVQQQKPPVQQQKPPVQQPPYQPPRQTPVQKQSQVHPPIRNGNSQQPAGQDSYAPQPPVPPQGGYPQQGASQGGYQPPVPPQGGYPQQGASQGVYQPPVPPQGGYPQQGASQGGYYRQPEYGAYSQDAGYAQGYRDGYADRERESRAYQEIQGGGRFQRNDGSSGQPPLPPFFASSRYRQPSEEEETTVISRNTVIDGNIRSFANMSVDGNIKGNVETTKDIDLNGKVVGNIACNNAQMRTSQIQGNIQMKGSAYMERDTLLIGDISSTYANVNGKIKGNMDITGKAELKSDAVVFGDISASTITVSDGAIIQGYVSTTFLNKEESRNIFPDTITIGD